MCTEIVKKGANDSLWNICGRWDGTLGLAESRCRTLSSAGHWKRRWTDALSHIDPHSEHSFLFQSMIKLVFRRMWVGANDLHASLVGSTASPRKIWKQFFSQPFSFGFSIHSFYLLVWFTDIAFIEALRQRRVRQSECIGWLSKLHCAWLLEFDLESDLGSSHLDRSRLVPRL